jgi:hypothetical protein
MTALEQLSAWLQHGPPAARVAAVECEPLPEQSYSGFESR